MTTNDPHDDQRPTDDDLFASLERLAASEDAATMLADLAKRLANAKRWHALFDVRLLEARLAVGLPLSGETGPIDPAARAALDERSLAACREVGWPLLDQGQPAAAWMYLRAAAEPSEVASRLAEVASRADLPDRDTVRGEAMQIAVWEGVDPALGLRLVIEDHGTCNAITAYMQSVARLPAARRRSAAGVLVDHLHDECIERGSHVDLSHLHNVLEIARECTDPARIAKALALADYGRTAPEDLLMPGEPPFEELAVASQWFFGAQLGKDTDEAVSYFTAKAAEAHDDPAPKEWLAVLLWRIGRAKEALAIMLDRDPAAGSAAGGLLPSLVELAVTADEVPVLLDACRRRDDPVTFAATLAAYQNFKSRQKP